MYIKENRYVVLIILPCFSGFTPSIPYYDGRRSFTAYPTLSDSFFMTFLYLEIRPASLDGLVLLNTQMNGPDFIAIALRQGRVEFWYDLGQGSVNISTNFSLSLNEWHTIQASRTGMSGELVVNRMSPVLGQSPGFFTMLQISDNLYLGAAQTPLSLPTQLRNLNGFNGCIRQFRTTRFSTSPVNLISEALSGRGVSECPTVSTCNPLSCLNGATCMNTIDSFTCLCAVGFTGMRCEIDVCATSNPCQNGGVCYVQQLEGQEVTRCNCSAPFTGQNCSNSE